MIRNKIQKKQLKEFGFLIGFGFPIIIGLILPYLAGHTFRYWTLWIGIPCLFIGVIKPNLLKYPYKFWMKLGHILGFINSKLILGLVFLIVLLPIAFIMKLFNYDPLKKIKLTTKSYREINNNKINYKRIF